MQTQSVNSVLYDLQNQVIDDEITVDQFINKTKELDVYDQMIMDFNKSNTTDMYVYITEVMTDFISCL